AVKLRAEDGRFVKDVDISLFINDLPNGKDTGCFSTLDASGSTSQAAGIAESIEAGSRLFLIDEDTSATNFMVRDAFMQEVISRSKEPITPFLERAGQLYEQAGISTILVAGSSGAFFHIADTIIQMDCY
ncbi:ABC-ATPase domain-containing protein, partial [Intestinibacillus massiliensis]|nr:ABC-ATPase domain-containing protein [Intestinibacillus massiliensis]